MAVSAVFSSSPSLSGKALLEKADRCFRLAQFQTAFKNCDDAVKSSDFAASWKDKKQHEVIKTYIVYGRQSGKSQAVLRWLEENRAQLPDYPLYLCEWVHVELGDKDPKKLRVSSHEALKKSEANLNAVITEFSADSTQKGASKVVNMCLNTLVDKVLLPNGQVSKAEQLMKEHSQHLSKDMELALQQKIKEVRKPPPAQRAAAAATTSRVAARRHASGSTSGTAPQIDPNSVLGQLFGTWKTLVDKLGGNPAFTASAAMVIVGLVVHKVVLVARGTPQPPSATDLDTF